MFAYISGNIAEKNFSNVVIDVQGIGYLIEVSMYTYSKIENLQKAKLFTHLYVREDAQILYGFAEKEERTLFLLLISVSGIGPNTARMMLSSLSPEDIKQAIISENVPVIQSVKGIGPKTAKRAIIDLKDKLAKLPDSEGSISSFSDNTIREQALSALAALGFSKGDGLKAVNKALKDNDSIDTVEILIKTALKNL